MNGRWILLCYLGLCAASACLSDSSTRAKSDDWPRLSAPGSTERHIESLGTEAGLWGSLSLGLEAWVYPFKAFDSLELGLIGSDGRFQAIKSHVKEQIASPDESVLIFKESDWSLKASLFVPRNLPGGTLTFAGILPQGTSLGVRLRPVVTPMHLEIEEALRMQWDTAREGVLFVNEALGAALTLSVDSLESVTRLASGKVALNFGSLTEYPAQLSFALDSDLENESSTEMTMSILRDSGETLRKESREYYRGLLNHMPLVTTPNVEVNRALRWAGISLDQLRIRNPDLGWGLVSGYSSSQGSTRPKYTWYFEEPTLTSFSFHWLGLSSHVRESLRFLSRYQRADGKTVHEVSQSLKYWPSFFDSFRYAYMHTDGPVYYLVAYGHYLRSTGDIEFIRSQWGMIGKTYEWCKQQMDPADSLITIDRGDWGSAEGSTDILKDTQLELMWGRALKEMSYLAQHLGDEEISDEAELLTRRVASSIENQLWDESQGFYIWGVNRSGEKVSSLVPHHAVGFWLGDLRDDRTSRALQTLAGSEFMTDWGVRSLALGDPKFDESSYQSGSVWPVWNAGVIISDFKRGQSVRGFQNWLATVQSRWMGALGPMPEVFRGDRFELLPNAVPHQMFSEVAVVNGFYDGLLGLEIDVPNRRLVIAPRLPSDWDRVTVERVPFGSESFDLSVQKGDGRYEIILQSNFTDPVACAFRPEIPADSLVTRVKDAEGEPYFKVDRESAVKVVEVERELSSGLYKLEVFHSRGTELGLIAEKLEEGSRSRQIRVLQYELKGGRWELELEGLPGVPYRLGLRGAKAPVDLSGGSIVESRSDEIVVETVGDSSLERNKAGYVRWSLGWKLEERPDRRDLLFQASMRTGLRIESRDQWEEKTSRIRRRMMEVMGRLPSEERRVPLRIEIIEEEDCGSYVRRLIEFQSEPSSRTPAYLCIPKTCLSGDRVAPGILCLHPTDDRVGHKVVLGLGGLPGRNYAEELAQQGFITIAPSYPLLADYQPDLEQLGYSSGTMKAVWDNMRAVDLLQSLEFVESGAIGAIGHSLGGHNAIYTAVFDSRIRAIATSCAFDSYLDYKGGDIRGWTSERYMPELLDYRLEEIPFDFHELLGALAPRGVFVSAPKGDSNFQWESVARIISAVESVYSLFGAESSLRARYPDCGHDFPEAMRSEAYEFLAEQLSETP